MVDNDGLAQDKAEAEADLRNKLFKFVTIQLSSLT